MPAMPLAYLLVLAQPPGLPGDQGVGARTEGDNPPDSLVTVVGQLELTYAVASYGFDAFELSTVPTDATVKRAFFVTGVWNRPDQPPHEISFQFNGDSYGPVEASFIDANDTGDPTDDLSLGGFLIDVTGSIDGNGIYPFTVTHGQLGTGPWSSLLCLVYEHELAPWHEIYLTFGAESLRYSSSSTTIDVSAGGDAVMHLFVEADQSDYSSGTESISFDKDVIACCSVFDANQGDFGSYFELPVVAATGTNVITIATGEDWFRWHFVGLVVSPAPVTVTPRSWGKVKSLYR